MSSTLRFVFKCGHVSNPISVRKTGNGGPTYQGSSNICWDCWRAQDAQKTAEEHQNETNGPEGPSRVQRGGDPEGPTSATQPGQRESIIAMFHSTCGHISQTQSLGVESVWRVFLVVADDNLCWDCEVAQRAQAAQQPFQEQPPSQVQRGGLSSSLFGSSNPSTQQPTDDRQPSQVQRGGFPGSLF